MRTAKNLTQPSTTALLNAVVVCALVAVFVAPHLVQAREPAACKAPKVKLATVMKQLKKWRGYAPIKGLQIKEQHIAACLSSDGTARLFAMLVAKHGSSPTEWTTDLAVSVSNKTGKPVDTKATRAQLSRAAAAVGKLPLQALKDPLVALWTTAYGMPKLAVMDDQGGHGTPCYELMEPSKNRTMTLKYCGRGEGLRRITLAGFASLPIPELAGVTRELGAKVAPCRLGRADANRLANGKTMATWRISVQLTGSDACKGRVTATGNDRTGWKYK
jgi:hypothetical protein